MAAKKKTSSVSLFVLFERAFHCRAVASTVFASTVFASTALFGCTTTVVTREKTPTTSVHVGAEEGFALSDVKLDNVSAWFFSRRFNVSTGPHLISLKFSVEGKGCPPRSYSCSNLTRRGRCDIPIHAAGVPIEVTIQRAAEGVEARVESQSAAVPIACRVESTSRRYDQKLFEGQRFYNE